MNRMDLYKECGLESTVNTLWSTESLTDAASEYTSRNKFKLGNVNAYAAAGRLGLLDFVCGHMDAIPETFQVNVRWTNDLLIDVCNKYNNFTEFRRKEAGAYSSLKRRKLVDKYTSHMVRKVQRFKSLHNKTMGLYTLYQDDEIVYIGKSITMISRLGTHVSDDTKIFNKIEVYEIESELDMLVAEVFLIATHQPKYNKDIISRDVEDTVSLKIPNISDIIQKTHIYEVSNHICTLIKEG